MNPYNIADLVLDPFFSPLEKALAHGLTELGLKAKL